MEMTLNDYYKKTYTEYYIRYDSKGNFKEGKGLCPSRVVKEVEKEIKKHITKRRKNDMYVKAIYNNEVKRVVTIYVIKEYVYNRITGWETIF